MRDGLLQAIHAGHQAVAHAVLLPPSLNAH